MCGIVGAISLKEKTIDTSFAKAMTDKLSHRGPDDAGYMFFHSGCRHKGVSFFLNAGDRRFSGLSPLLPDIQSEAFLNELGSHDWDIFLGHRRLSILDLSPAGHQPMSDLSKNIWIVYNGEIYNFKELKAELKRLGHKFSTNTDTEVLIYAYAEWGIGMINRLNGMFAFCLYDNFQKKLYLARDRYGIKPLYYTLLANQTLVFGSESKAILEYGEYKRELDKEALLEYFTFQNIFTDKTLHKNIKLLEAGNYIELDISAAKLEKKQYWDFDFSQSDEIKDKREYEEEFDRLFTQAVKRQLVSDVEVGAYLSGGLDSGSIVSIASREIRDLKSFTVGFDLHSASGIELSFDERERAEHMSYLFKTEHYEMVLKSGDMERCMPSFAYHLEEPRVGQSYPNYYASKLAGKFVKVALSGAGGDELFGGYPWRYYSAAGSQNFDEYIDKYYAFWQRLIPNQEIKNLFAPITSDVSGVWTRDIFKGVFKRRFDMINTPEDYVNHSLYFEAKTFLHGLLVVEDKLSMAHSLETRVPFLDNDLVDFAQKLPVKYKLEKFGAHNVDENSIAKYAATHSKTNDGKILVRNVMQRYIPQDITLAVKQGFSSPDNSWFKGESIDFVKNLINDDKSRIYDYFDKKTVRSLVGEHMDGRQNRRLFVWSLLNFEEWCGIYDK